MNIYRSEVGELINDIFGSSDEEEEFEVMFIHMLSNWRYFHYKSIMSFITAVFLGFWCS